MIRIAPSILSADFAKLGEEIQEVEKAGADFIHIDVMDGHFVPNITIGPPVVKALRKVSGLIFDVHLMIENADAYIDNFIDAGADIISVHVESCTHLHRTIQRIKQRGKKACVALNPATPIETLKWILPDVGMVLLMTVNPGFGGQSYIDAMTEKIAALNHMITAGKYNIDIEIDGGIDTSNIYMVTKAGADVIVAGSAIFNSVSRRTVINEMRDKAWDPAQL